ncbi:MAG: AAA family ATPase [Pelagibacterales bacterium]|nr:AAA family ATPase [Pelagibacterales bacterium]
MYYLKNIHLKNFCGYKDTSLSFSHNGKYNPISVLFGPNGEGKSTLLHAIRLISNPYQFFGRENDMFFRKLVFNEDYDPVIDGYIEPKHKLHLSAEYCDSNGEKYNSILDHKGLVESSLGRYNSDQDGWSMYCDTDHPINMNKFQLYSKNKKIFLSLAKCIYGLEVNLEKKIESSWIDRTTKEVVEFYQDFIINKKEVRVHFRRMSDGEKKIATLLRFLCDEVTFNPSNIVVIDNIDMHVYFKRHSILIDKLVELFPNKQFIVTTHSETMINHVKKSFGKHCTYDLESIKH